MKTNDYAELGRVGVVDVGSNSVRLVVFDGAARSPSYFYNEKVLCELGKGLVRSGVLNPEGKKSAIATMRRFKMLADHMKLNSLGAVATAAVREASDGEEFCKQIRQETGIELYAISGDEEAKLSSKGVLLGWPKASGLMCDLGGSSMELAQIEDGIIETVTTTALGPLSIVDLSNDADLRDEMVADEIEASTRKFARQQPNIYLVGGALRVIAKYHMHITNYPLHVLHNYVLPIQELKRTLRLLKNADMNEVKEVISIPEGRLRLLPEAVRVLGKVLDRFDIQNAIFSSYGLREGLLYERMPKGLQSRDPLIEACRAIELKNARFPGFGSHLYSWVLPLFPDVDEDRKRLMRAACLMHDVHWASHPDYRAEVCFDGAMLSNLGGIGHSGRVYVAWALLYRYRSKFMPNNYVALQELLTNEDRTQAQALGKAMRLGAMMSGSNPSLLGKLRMTKTVLEISLDNKSQNIFGEVVQRRFESLANSLDRKPIISYV